ncbi:MAG: hypothetical protein NXI15_01725 [Gammaproteobacteria bacterium]|jgi:hypothetical protein|nr:hypothetical protein [Gammaproteobacteria bacterium]
MEKRYNIYYSGQIADQHDPAQVRQNLGKIFKADDSVLDKLFSGDLQLLKKNCDADTASKYEQAMARAGAVAIVRTLEANDAPADQASATDQPSAAQPTKKLTTAERVAALTAASGEDTFGASEEELARAFKEWASPQDSADKLRVTPRGTEVLRPEERAPAPQRSIDTSALRVDEQAQRLAEPGKPPPPAPDTSHLDVSAPGELIPNLPSAELPLEPDITALDLTPQGTDFADCAAQPAPPPSVDLSAIALAPTGSELIEDKYRKGAPPPPPSTDHITVEE